jgi:hypothetical protein
MENQDQLISKILNTPPYQLPPVVHTSGVYQIDVTYRGVNFDIVSGRLEHVLERYLKFCVEQNDRERFTAKDFNQLPTPYGETIRVRYTRHEIGPTIID